MIVDEVIKAVTFLSSKKARKALMLLINIVLCWIISSVVFEHFYFKYDFLDLNDYPSIINYLRTGGFILPVFVFSLVWFITKHIFIFYNETRRQRYVKKIELFGMEKSKIAEELKNTTAIKNILKVGKVIMSRKCELSFITGN